MKLKSKIENSWTKFKSMRIGQICEKFRKPFNFCWKFGAAVIGIVLAISLADALWRTAKDHLGLRHYYWMDEDLTDNIEIRTFGNNQCATFNRITDERLSPKVRWISCVPDRDSLTVFCDKDGRRGFLNVNTGRVVIDGQYRHAWHFSEGLAAVVGDNGKVGFVNYDNELVVPMMFEYVEGYDYLFVRGNCILKDGETGKYGVIDTLGNVVLPMEYDNIFEASEWDDTWYVRKDGKCGLLGSDMSFIFPVEYDNIDVDVPDGSAFLTSGAVKQLVSYDGEVIEPFVINSTWELKYVVKYNDDSVDEYALHPYLVGFNIDYEKCGVMDTRTGKVVVPALYRDINMVSKNIISATVGYYEDILFFTDGSRVNVK